MAEESKKKKFFFLIVKEENCQPRILYPGKLSFKNTGKINIFSKNENLEDFIVRRPILKY